MSPEQNKKLFQFLASSWYDRDEDDNEIIREIVSEGDPQYIADSVHLIRQLLASSEPQAEKAKFIRHSAWRSMGKDDAAPLQWLSGIADQLEQAQKDTRLTPG